MTAAAQLEVAGSGRSAPSDGHLNPHRNEGGKSAKPAAVLPPNVRNFRLTLTPADAAEVMVVRQDPFPAPAEAGVGAAPRL